jgi:hypothetical protein
MTREQEQSPLAALLLLNSNTASRDNLAFGRVEDVFGVLFAFVFPLLQDSGLQLSHACAELQLENFSLLSHASFHIKVTPSAMQSHKWARNIDQKVSQWQKRAVQRF